MREETDLPQADGDGIDEIGVKVLEGEMILRREVLKRGLRHKVAVVF
jgi:hypothetical protein